MKLTPTVTVTLPSDRQITMTRWFDALRHVVFRAMTTPTLVKRWLLGPPGWSMPVCEIDLRVGGNFRYVWHQDSTGITMGLRGIYREIEAPARIAHNETFDEPWFSGGCRCVQVLDETDSQTLLTTTLTYDSRAVRDGVLKSNMTKGVSASYDLLDNVLTEELL
jgi:uncharacterized protein YndB with AHSA1/START domain